MKTKILFIALMITSLSFAQTDSTKVNNFQKTDEVLSEVVKKALTVAEKTGDFVIEQAPLLLQEFYAWHIFSKIFWIIFSIILIFIGRYLPNLWLHKSPIRSNSDEFFGKYIYDGFGTWVFFSLSIISGSVIMITNLYNLIYILVAPKLYLIDYFIK